MQAMGLKVTALPGGEIMPAMQKGVIEAFEYNNPTSDRRFGAADVAKFYMLSSYHQPSECLEIEFNKTKFESLAKEQQAILTPRRCRGVLDQPAGWPTRTIRRICRL